MSSTQPVQIGFTLLLSRIVLGTALFFAGWHACFQEVEFSPEEIRTLEGVGAVAVPVSWLQAAPEEAAAPADDATEQTSAKPISPMAASVKAVLETGSHSSSDEVASGSIKRVGAERIALCLRTHGFGEWSEPTAWATAVVKLLGGALLVLGLLTRLWAFLAAVIFGVTFWLGSVETAGMFSTNPLGWVDAGGGFQQMYFVLAMFVLSFGLLAGGPGILSLDRLFWPGRRPSGPVTHLATTDNEPH